MNMVAVQNLKGEIIQNRRNREKKIRSPIGVKINQIPDITRVLGWVMMFNATFNNISVISWKSVLLVEETRVNHRPAASH
jgi:hypothetical protein